MTAQSETDQTNDERSNLEVPRNNDSPEYLLTNSAIPEFDGDQMRLITSESIMEREIEPYDPEKAITSLRNNEGKKILTLDLGGGSAKKNVWTIKDGILIEDPISRDAASKKDSGANYMPFFQEAARQAEKEGLAVAISFAGPLKGTSPLSIPNAPAFFNALQAEYGGDFASLFPSLLAVNNDAQAGIKIAAIVARRTLVQENTLNPDLKILFVINGGGFGLALLINNQLRATEVGHARLLDKFNRFGQTVPCGMFGNTFVCLERVAAGGAAIEPLYGKIMGGMFEGSEISRRYQNGDLIARGLYENSALIYAHGILAVAAIDDLLQNSKDTLVVYHGGTFRTPGLKERIHQILGKKLGFQPPMMFTDDISVNACAEGAAIAGFYNSSRQKN